MSEKKLEKLLSGEVARFNYWELTEILFQFPENVNTLMIQKTSDCFYAKVDDITVRKAQEEKEVKDMNDKKYIEQVANMLGLELLEEFKIKPTEYGKLLGHKEDERVFRFDSELVYKGYDDGWSEWYGFKCDKVLYHLILGIYKVVRL